MNNLLVERVAKRYEELGDPVTAKLIKSIYALGRLDGASEYKEIPEELEDALEAERWAENL